MSVNDEIPKSRLTLTYKTTVSGQLEEVNLPLRLLLMGDLSKGSSADQKVDLDERDVRNLNGKNISELMKSMGISLGFEVANKIDPDNAEDLAIDLKFDDMRSFSPDAVAEQIPKVKGLLLLKKLLLEMQSNMDNRKEFRKLLSALAKDGDAIKNLADELKDYQSFKVPGRDADSAE